MPSRFPFRRRTAANAFARVCAMVWVLAAVLSTCEYARAECAEGNLLLHRAPSSTRGVTGPAPLSDGLFGFEGDDAESPIAVRMKGIRPYVEWDLGGVTHVSAATAQLDNNDAYRLTGSVDGEGYTALWAIPVAPDRGLRQRTTKDLNSDVRFVRLEALAGDKVLAASEVQVFCQVPDPWPPTPIVRDHRVLEPGTDVQARIDSLKIMVGVAALALLFVVLPRLRRRAARGAVLWAVLLSSALVWSNIGAIQGCASVHYWDMFHYFMGTKYFPELGYFELYRCVAVSEREAGRGADVDRHSIRDLEDGLLYPGDSTRTREGGCRTQARFSAERWREFRSDQEIFRARLGRSMSDSFSDHGFNATPLNATWLRLFTHGLTATQAHLIALTNLDLVALAGAVAFLWWGFGAVPAVAGAVFLAVGAPWGYQWIGGSLGRQTWLLCACAGFAFLSKDRPFSAGALLTLSGLLRLFPFVFVGAVGLWCVVRSIRARTFDGWARRYFAGFALTFALGTAVAGLAVGPHAYKEFVQVFKRHSGAVSSNEIGLSMLLGWGADNSPLDPRLTDPSEAWENDQALHRTERQPLWASAVGISLVVLVVAAWQGAPPVVGAALSGLLLYSLLPMTSYDYSWLVLLIALASSRPTVLPRLIVFALLTQILALLGGLGTLLEQHVILSLGCGALLISLVPWRDLVEGRAYAKEAPAT